MAETPAPAPRHERQAYDDYARAADLLGFLSRKIQAARAAEQNDTRQRDAKILEFFERGWITQQQIAVATGLSVIRVRQIVKDQRRKRAVEKQEEEA